MKKQLRTKETALSPGFWRLVETVSTGFAACGGDDDDDDDDDDHDHDHDAADHDHAE